MTTHSFISNFSFEYEAITYQIHLANPNSSYRRFISDANDE